MRSSKFRHVFGEPVKKEKCYENIRITKNQHDSHFCSVNPLFLAVVTESAGGGAFVVLPLEKVSDSTADIPFISRRRTLPVEKNIALPVQSAENTRLAFSDHKLKFCILWFDQ